MPHLKQLTQTVQCLLFLLFCSAALFADEAKERKIGSDRSMVIAPVFLIADGLNADGQLIENYQRGLRYAIDYFGNYGPPFACLPLHRQSGGRPQQRITTSKTVETFFMGDFTLLPWTPEPRTINGYLSGLGSTFQSLFRRAP